MAKNTVLGDDANIYKQRAPEKESIKFKGLTFKKKLQYIKDYYLKAALAGGIMFVLVLYLIIKLVMPKDEVVLRAVVINDTYNVKDTEALINDFGKTIDYNPSKEDITIQDGLAQEPDSMNANVRDQVTIYATTGTLDVIIADKDVFSSYAKDGFFCDLSEVFSKEELDSLSNGLFYSKKKLLDGDTSDPAELKTKESDTEQAFGVCLDDSTIYTGISEWYKHQKEVGTSISYYIGIVNNSSQKENAVAFINYLKGKK